MNSIKSIIAWLAPWPTMFVADYGRYLFAVGFVSLTVWSLTLRAKRQRAVRKRQPAKGQRRREFMNSTVATAVFATVGFGIYQGSTVGLFTLYQPVSRYGVAYWIFSLLLMVMLHDTYFYWTHRLMHQPAVFSWTHRTHHQSVAPTQFAAYSFSVVEALIQAAFVPIFLLVVPVHASVLLAWGLHQVMRNAMGHAGIELEPHRWLAGWWGRYLTTTLHHDLHHVHSQGNYGLYFTCWDRWCGTERDDYRSRLRMLLDGIEPARLENPTRNNS